MNEIILLGLGIVTTTFISIFYFIVKRTKKRLRRYMLRFEKIKDKLE